MNTSSIQRVTYVAIVMALVGLFGCSDPEPAAVEDAAAPPPETAVPSTPVPVDPGMIVGEWILVSLRGGRISDGVEIPTLEIADDGEVSGFGGVNRFTTRIDADEFHDGRFTFGPAAVTKMAGPAGAMELERVFLQRLGSVSRYVMKGDELRLSDDDGVSMVFARPSES
jgi:heat shock protein HslJ